MNRYNQILESQRQVARLQLRIHHRSNLTLRQAATFTCRKLEMEDIKKSLWWLIQFKQRFLLKTLGSHNLRDQCLMMTILWLMIPNLKCIFRCPTQHMKALEQCKVIHSRRTTTNSSSNRWPPHITLLKEAILESNHNK